MARFCLLSEFGDMAFLGLRLQEEGHEVWLHIKDPASRHVYDGMLPKLKTPTPPPGSTVVFDTTNRGALATALRRQGFPVIGGNPIDRDLEVMRTSGFEIMESIGLSVPEWHPFASVKDAIRFLRREAEDGGWYFKPNGDAPTTLTHNDDSNDEMIAWLEAVEPRLAGVKSFVLQKKQEGIEIDCDGWFDGQRWVYPFCSTIEDKKAWTGELGARGGCASNVVWRWPGPRPPFPMATVMRLEPILREARYVGNIALNTIVDSEGTPHGLEWSARFGFDALQAFALLVRGDLGEQLAAFARGHLDRFDVGPDLALTLRLSCPPYPLEAPELAQANLGIPVDPRLDGSHPRVFPDDVMVTKGRARLAGRDGSVGTVGIVGDDIAQMRHDLVEFAKDIRIDDKQMRTDPVERYERAMGMLANFGYRDVEEAA